MSTFPTYAAGQSVTFEGRPATIVSATEPRPNLLGVTTQTLEVRDANGMSFLIGSSHTALVPLGEDA